MRVTLTPDMVDYVADANRHHYVETVTVETWEDGTARIDITTDEDLSLSRYFTV